MKKLKALGIERYLTRCEDEFVGGKAVRVLFQTNIPSPYRVDFFNELGKYCDLTVLFESHSAKDRNAAWVADGIKNFTAINLRGKRVGTAEAFCPSIIKYLSKEKFDVIVIGFFSSPTGMMAIEYMRMKHIPFVLSSDGGMIKNDGKIKYSIKRHFIGGANAWLSTGKITTEYLTHYGADPKMIYTYPFTSVREADILEQPLAIKEKQIYRKLLGMKEEHIILSVGQFIHRKGYDVLLGACKEFDSSVGVYIVGGKPTEEYLNLKKQLELEHVHFVDFMTKDKLANYYKAADVFVLPTREDIWGLVINEAMSYGLPIVTTKSCVAGLEMIHEGRSGYIVPVDNSFLLQEALIKSFDLSGKDVLNDAKKYTIERMAKCHITAFELILRQKELCV